MIDDGRIGMRRLHKRSASMAAAPAAQGCGGYRIVHGDAATISQVSEDK
jgi:hypothetical protein